MAEAASLPEVRPVHLLYGLCVDQSGFGWKALYELGITQDMVRKQALDVGENSRSSKLAIEELPPSVECKLALEQAWHAASKMGSSSIQTEHVLLGLIQGNVLSQFVIGAYKDASVLEERVRELIRMSKLDN